MKSLAIAYQQQETGYYCGPAVTRILLSARLAHDELPTQARLAQVQGTTQQNGTYRTGVLKGLDDRRYAIRPVGDPMSQQQKELLWKDVRRNLSSDYGLAVNIVVRPDGPRPPGWANPSKKIDHWVAIVGYDDDHTVEIADPAAGRPRFGHSPRYWMPVRDLHPLITKVYLA